MAIDESRFRDCVIRALRIRPEQYTPTLAMGDVVEWDSLAQLDLCTTLESEFGYQFSIEQMSELSSLQQFRAVLNLATP